LGVLQRDGKLILIDISKSHTFKVAT